MDRDSIMRPRASGTGNGRGAVGLAVLCAAACVTTSCRTPSRGGQAAFGYGSLRGADVALNFEAMASLPDQTLFLGGYYTDGANYIHSALWVSTDGGWTWAESGPRFGGASVLNLQTRGTNCAWAVVTFRSEGACEPTHVLRSIDGGKTWKAVALDFLKLLGPLPHVTQFQFLDEDRGLLTVEASTGGFQTWYSRDGGRRWSLLWYGKGSPDEERDYVYPEGRDAVPLHAPTWSREAGARRIGGITRVQESNEVFLIEFFDYETQSWFVCSTIPAIWKAEGARLIPAEPGPGDQPAP
jgi:hypothetical protein